MIDRPGIYIIQNMDNGKVYVGSTVNLRKRWIKHKFHLNRGDHHSLHLQRAWDKYGESAFVFKPLAVLEVSMHRDVESELIKHYRSDEKDHGYNICSEWRSRLGVKSSSKTKRAISRSIKEWHKSVDPKQRKRWASKGGKASALLPREPVSDSAKTNMSKAAVRRFSDKTEREQQRIRITALSGRPIVVHKYDTQEYVGTFPSIRECVRALGIEQCRRGVKYALDGKYKQAKGYTFAYAE